MSTHREFDMGRVRPCPFQRQVHKVRVEQFASAPQKHASFLDFLASFPHLAAGEDVRQVARAIAQARESHRAVIATCGAHVVKCGLSPVLIALMEQGFLSALAIHGAVAIHDIEIALFGATSEDVVAGLEAGTFGMAAETAAFYNRAIARGHAEQVGAGEALGRALGEENAPHASQSLLAAGYRLGIPVTVHIAIGTDVVHMHPSADGAALGEVTMRDFRILTAAMENLSQGGVLMNLGSAVILPEILLKAIAILRNQDPLFSRFLGVNLDMIQQYRSNEQVVARVKALGGTGISLTGHHEIMLPLLAFAVLEAAEHQ